MNPAFIKRLFLILAVSIAPTNLHAQDSLGEVARQNRSSKPGASRAKVIVDEDSSPIRNKSPFPNLAMTGFDNTDEIIRAVEAYRTGHTPEEVESSVHAWFDEYDAVLEKTIAEQIAIKDRQSSRYYGSHYSTLDRTNDNRQYEQRQIAEARAADDDRRRYGIDGLACARIQQAFGRVRNYLTSKNLKYEWFKIRFGNGNGSW
jgi:hypothetical protein